jgi:hypothetical protein
MSLNPDVSLKLTLATATILTGCALRVTRVVTRENGESLLAVVFGILLPSLLIQVRDDVLERKRCLEFGYTEILSACARSGGTRSLCVGRSSSSLSSSSSRVSVRSFFFSRVSFLSIGTKELAR